MLFLELLTCGERCCRLRFGRGAGVCKCGDVTGGWILEVRDIKAMAAHRHSILVAESSAQRMGMEAPMQEIPPQACPPGFRPPPLLWELPLSNIFPPGFSPSAVYNEPLLPQSCPPGFRPSVQHVKSSTIMQLETKFGSGDLITYRPENRLGDRPEFRHDTTWVSSMYGAADRHGWYHNGSAGVGRVCESSNGTVDRCHDRQESRTRRSPPHYQRGSLSFRGGNPARINLEVSQNLELRCRPSLLRPISQRDRFSRASPRPFYSNGRNKQYRNDPCFDVRHRPSNCGSWCPRSSLRSRSPNRRSNCAKESLRVGQCRWRRRSWPPQLLAGYNSSGPETDVHVADWRSADGPGEVERNAEENGPLTILHSSEAGEEHAKYDRSRSDFQVPDVLGKQQRFAEDSVAQLASNSVEKMALALTDRVKNEKSFSLPVRSGTTQKLPEMKPEVEQCGSVEKNLPSYRNGSQLSDEKAGSIVAKHARTIGENQPGSGSSISATSLKRARYFTNIKLAPKYYSSQDPEVNSRTSPVKVTPRSRRTVIVSAGSPLDKLSGFDEEAVLPGEEQDEAEEGEILLTKNTSKPFLGPRLLSERSSIASETEFNEGVLIKPFVALSRVSSELTVHLPSEVDVTNSQVNSVSAVKKWIVSGIGSKHFPSVKSLTATNGFNLLSPESVVKSQTSGGCLSAEDAPGCSCSQQMEEVLPASTVRNGRGLLCSGLKKASGKSSVRKTDLFSLDKDQEICTAGKLKSEVIFLKDSAAVPETPKQELSFTVEKSFLRELPVHKQNLERNFFVNPGTEGQLRSSSRSFVGCMRVNPVVGKSGSLLDDWLCGITSTIPLAAETNKRFQPNCSTSDSPNVFVKSEQIDPLSSQGVKTAEQLCGLFRGKTTSVMELVRVVTDKKEAALVQSEQDTKVVSRSSDLRDAPAGEGNKLARHLNREDRGRGESLTRLASCLMNAGASPVAEGTEVMSIVPQHSDIQDLKIKGGNIQAEQLEKGTIGGSGLATKLDRVMMRAGEAALTSSEDDIEVITETSRDVVATVLRFDRELGKRRKIMHLEKRVNLNQVIIADDPTAKAMKTNVLESSCGTGKVKADSIWMKKQIPSVKGGIQCNVPVLKTTDTLPLSNHLSVPPAVTPLLRAVGRSYASNKTWRREATHVNGQEFSSTLQKPALVAIPCTYVRKNFSIIRYPASQVPLQSSVGAEPNALSKFSQRSVAQSRNKKYSLSASKSIGDSHVAKTAASASFNVKTSIAKIRELDAMLTKELSPSPVRRAHSVGNDTLFTHSESILSDLTPISKISPSKSPHCEGSSGPTTLVCSPASKSPGRATNEVVGYVVSGTRLYRKRKFDRVGPSTTSASPTGLEKFDVPLGYMKRKTNQLVRCYYPEVSAHDALQNVVEGNSQVKFMTGQRTNSAQLKTKLNRGIPRDWRHPLLPWKKYDIVAPCLRRGRSLHQGKMGALFFYKTNQSQKHRSAHLVYTRSADGFSLHRSGVISKRGANLKSSKYLKTQSTLASETATKVAEAEKKKRDKKEAVVRAVAKARDEQRAKSISGFVDSSSVPSLNQLGIGGVVYVRKGFGNQLVRNSKTVARVVASEKFRWSLRNARLRRAKKQDICVYYTRFGICKRGDGKCLYVHDPDKVAVCTKFLRGSCSDPACRLTHQVIPERLSDCLYFLEGLCTNERCPYRHVNVNKEAPICEAFLQGCCAEGDKCNKKHTYVCPEYTLSGSCLSSNCNLRHPKKTKQLTNASKDNADSEMDQKGPKRELQKGRYFTLTAHADGDYQGHPVSTANAAGDKVAGSDDDLLDFISVDEYGLELSEQSEDTGAV